MTRSTHRGLKGVAARLRNIFLAGIIFLLPVAATFFVLRAVFNWVDGILASRVAELTGYRIPGLGAITTILLVLLAGLVATNFLGRRVILFTERIVARTPIVRNVYITMKQITDAFVQPNQTAFKRVVMFDFPHRGVWAIGFVTGQAAGEPERLAGEPVVTVFMPTTPNPTTGFLFLLPLSKVVFLDMPVEQGLKMVVSGGVLSPLEINRLEAPAELVLGSGEDN
jgi:uncharacterized membrane protein